MSRWLKRLGLVFSIPLLFIIGGALYVLFKWTFYKQLDDKVHLAPTLMDWNAIPNPKDAARLKAALEARVAEDKANVRGWK